MAQEQFIPCGAAETFRHFYQFLLCCWLLLLLVRQWSSFIIFINYLGNDLRIYSYLFHSFYEIINNFLSCLSTRQLHCYFVSSITEINIHFLYNLINYRNVLYPGSNIKISFRAVQFQYDISFPPQCLSTNQSSMNVHQKAFLEKWQVEFFINFGFLW
jgi:hypothetical protein